MDNLLPKIKSTLAESREKDGVWTLLEYIENRVKEILNDESQTLSESNDVIEALHLFLNKIEIILTPLKNFLKKEFTENGKYKEVRHTLGNKANPIYSIIEEDKEYLQRFLYLVDLGETGISDQIKSAKYILYFLESFYISNLDDPKVSDFIENQKIDYDIKDALAYVYNNLPFGGKFKEVVNFDRVESIVVNGLKGDFIIFIYNLIYNSRRRGKSNKIEFYTKEKNGKIFLCIADDGTGIDTGNFPDINDIFKLGNSGNNSSGIGLSKLEKRQIKCSISNNGLNSKFSDIEEVKKTNPNFKGKYNTRGALFEMELNTI